jgi:hypothetical protein
MEQTQQTVQLANPPRAVSPAAHRQRLSRARRREEMRVIRYEIRDSEIEALVARGWLPAADRGDRESVAIALGAMLDELQPARWPAAKGHATLPAPAPAPLDATLAAAVAAHVANAR